MLTDRAHIFAANDNNELIALKFSSLTDLPSDEILLQYIQQAVLLNTSDHADKKPSQRKNKNELVVPDDLAAALAEIPQAQAFFNDFSYSKQKDYIDWLTSAKRENTRASRLATAIEWISAGKARHWKYQNC